MGRGKRFLQGKYIPLGIMSTYIKITVLGIIVIGIISTCHAQMKLKKPETKIAPVPPFTFLVEGGNMSVASTVRLEQLDTYTNWSRFSRIGVEADTSLVHTGV